MELKTYFPQDTAGNFLPLATCYLYRRGTENLVSGLVKANGVALTNPFTGNAEGPVQFSAPNGIYDLRIVKGTLDFRMPIQFNDVTEDVAAAVASAAQAAIIEAYVRDNLSLLLAQLNAIISDPQNAVNSWDIQAKGFDLLQGVATYGVVSNRLGAWQMPAGSAAYLAMPIAVPSHWRKMDVYVYWVNMAANDGNAVMGAEVHQWAPGESMNVTPAGSSSIITANPVPWAVNESKIAADLPLDPTRTVTLRIARQGASANDTLANALGILKVRIQKK
ncbi:hypothetical protein AEQ67_26480 [Pseudomonas sp. RIT-PI-q]|uniref:hypothetical protein n=1 Tax=Pseudomonas sp. RIT-PI-q TaxID=1690247 RepID=UPI0006CD1BAC|nr:hypothetical protein [Pseudomonas sp. RIT-PI-q]KPG92905.1 hypothetical protein AEQ67_26480 [Pseudomonas sp. RIT-PI-q]